VEQVLQLLQQLVEQTLTDLAPEGHIGKQGRCLRQNQVNQQQMAVEQRRLTGPQDVEVVLEEEVVLGGPGQTVAAVHVVNRAESNLATPGLNAKITKINNFQK